MNSTTAMESRYDRPDDWLGGYGPANSPVRAYGEKLVCSPKKKTSWRVAKDAKVQESLPAQIPDIDKPAKEKLGVLPVKKPESIQDNHPPAASEGVDYVEEEVTESNSGEEYIEELVVYSDESEESTEYSEDEEIEILDVEDQSSSGLQRLDSESEDFESLPPPINIPNELRPAHLRGNGPSTHDSIDDSSITADTEDEVPISTAKKATSPGAVLKEAPTVTQSLRPTTLRGMSFDSVEQPEGKSARRGGTRPKPSAQKEKREPTKCDSVEAAEEEQQVSSSPVPEIKAAPAVTDSLRPTTLRGMSFDSDDQPEAKPARRGGTRPKQSEPEEKPQPTASVAIDNDEVDNEDAKEYTWEKPSWTQPHLKPTGKADVMKTEGNLAAPITNIKEVAEKEKMELNFKKPEWTRESSLKGTKKGEMLKSGENLNRSIGCIKLVDE